MFYRAVYNDVKVEAGGKSNNVLTDHRMEAVLSSNIFASGSFFMPFGGSEAVCDGSCKAPPDSTAAAAAAAAALHLATLPGSTSSRLSIAF